MELGQSISCVLFYFALVCSVYSRVVHLFQYGCFYVCVPVSTIDLFPQKYVHATSILSAYVLYMYIQNVSYSIIMHNRTFLTEFVYFIYLFCTDFFCFLLFFCLLLFFSILLLFIFLFFFLSYIHLYCRTSAILRAKSPRPVLLYLDPCQLASFLQLLSTTRPLHRPILYLSRILSWSLFLDDDPLLSAYLVAYWLTSGLEFSSVFCLLISPLLSSCLFSSSTFSPLLSSSMLCSNPTIRSIAENESIFIHWLSLKSSNVCLSQLMHFYSTGTHDDVAYTPALQILSSSPPSTSQSLSFCLWQFLFSRQY